MTSIPNGSRPAFPTDRIADEAYHANGLTKREWFAGMALAGVCGAHGSASAETCARTAVTIADALLAELSREVAPARTPAEESEAMLRAALCYAAPATGRMAP